MLFYGIIAMCACLNNVQAEMEGHVVGGEEVDIERYPFSAYLNILCATMTSPAWSCGSSIINQHFTLTAAHCLEYCTQKGYISVGVGHNHKQRGVISSAFKIKSHKDYYDGTMNADIGLVRLKTPVKFGSKVQRVILMRNPPRQKLAYVAGWGAMNEHTGILSNWLKHAEQPLWSTEKCRNLLGDIPHGTICAGTKNGENFAAVGDSGSALVIRGQIQIGIVSFKIPHITTSVAVYTNVSLYYNWILKSTMSMACGK